MRRVHVMFECDAILQSTIQCPYKSTYTSVNSTNCVYIILVCI